LPWCLFGLYRGGAGKRRPDKGRLRSLLIAGTVLGCHAGIVAFLLARPERIIALRELPSLEVTYSPRPGTAVTTALAHAPSPSAWRRAHSGLEAESLVNRQAPTNVPSDPASNAQADRTSPPRPAPAVDWAAEIEAQVARNPASQITPFKDFGFAHAPEPASARAPEFAWDRVHTQRVQTLPEGGILVHLDDNCVLVFIPLPIAACGIGKKPANGDLFKDMTAPRE
jgi:hypothetical protein